jgi:hypothetical protein
MCLTDDTIGSHHAKVDKEAQRHLLGELGGADENECQRMENTIKRVSRLHFTK